MILDRVRTGDLGVLDVLRESLLRKHWNLQKRNFIGLKWTQFLGSILQKLKSFSFHRKFNVAQIVSLRRAASFYLGEKKIRPTNEAKSLRIINFCVSRNVYNFHICLIPRGQ